MSYSKDRYNHLIDKIELSFLPKLNDLYSPLSSSEEITISNEHLKSLGFIKQRLLVPLPIILNDEIKIEGLNVNKEQSKTKLNNFCLDLPKLSEVKSKLFEVWQETQINKKESEYEDFKVMKWYFLAQMTSATQCILINQIISHSNQLKDVINRWDRYKDGSLFSNLLYFIESLPFKTYNLFYNLILNNKFIEFNFNYNYINKFYYKVLNSPYNSLIKKPLYQLRKEIGYKIDRLEKYEKLNAASLGLLGGTVDSYTACDSDFDLLEKYIINSIKVQIKTLRTLQFDYESIPEVESLFNITEGDENLLEGNELFGNLHGVISLLESHKTQFDEVKSLYGPPGFWTRYIVPTLSTYFVYQKVASMIWEHKDDLLQYSIELKNTIIAFAKNWIIQPLVDMYQTIRYKNHKLNVISEESLKADILSLERMVLEFAKSHQIAPDQTLKVIQEQIQNGDMTLILKAYEKELQHPINGLVFGDLIQTLLIQVQKLKVDGGLALNALDTLLKSNEFTFGLIAVIPPILFVYYLITLLKNWYQSQLGRSRIGIHRQVRNSMHKLFRILNQSYESLDLNEDLKLKYLNQGYLLSEIQYLRHLIYLNPWFQNEEDRAYFLSYLKDLERFDWSLDKRLTVLNHLYRAFPYIVTLKR